MTAISSSDTAQGSLRAAAAHVAATNAVADAFFQENSDAIAAACHAMAERFQRGGRLFVSGDRAQRSDVAHVVVEFLHPVVVGKRALPAIGLPEIGSGAALVALDTMARDGDMLMVICAGRLGDDACALLASAQGRGVLTIALAGQTTASDVRANRHFAVPSLDPCVMQETHEMLYHVLWELVHVFFDHRPASQ